MKIDIDKLLEDTAELSKEVYIIDYQIDIDQFFD